MKYLSFTISFLIMSGLQAQSNKNETFTIRLKCSGVVRTESILNASKNTSVQKTFLVSIKVKNGKPSFDTTDLPILATKSSFARINQPNGLVEKLSDEQVSIGAEFTFIEPLKGGGQSTLVFNRYTGVAKQFEMLLFDSDSNRDVMSVNAEYECTSVEKKRF